MQQPQHYKITAYSKGKKQSMFIHTNCEELIQ